MKNKITPEIKARGEGATFQEYFKLSDEDMSYLWSLFMEFGMTREAAPHRSRGNHYFLQGIGQYHSVEWGTWGEHVTKELREIIKARFPQLMVQNKDFEK